MFKKRLDPFKPNLKTILKHGYFFLGHRSQGSSSEQIPFSESVTNTNDSPQISTTYTTTIPTSKVQSYNDGDFTVNWYSDTTSVYFTLTASVPTGVSTNFWAAFAFSTDTEMVINFFNTFILFCIIWRTSI